MWDATADPLAFNSDFVTHQSSPTWDLVSTRPMSVFFSQITENALISRQLHSDIHLKVQYMFKGVIKVLVAAQSHECDEEKRYYITHASKC